MKNIFRSLHAACLDNPVKSALIIAAFVRLIAVFTAKGFMASDDYFVYLHIPWVWSRGGNEWFAMDHPSGFSIIYPGMNYFFILAMRAIGLENPDHMMYINRALHAAWSMLGVWYAIRIAERATDNRHTILATGLFAGLLFVLPYASVRNLPEMVCVPFVMMFLFYAERATSDDNRRDALLAGLAIGAAFVVRYQALSFAPAAFLIFLLRKQWRAFFLLSLGVLIPLLVQGVVDAIAYGKFFGAPIQYFGYNFQHSGEYVVGPWYRYGLLLIGIFIPPFSVVFLGSTILARKKLPVLFWSTCIFLLAHSITPAKQERFIIPALMPIAVLGTLGMAALFNFAWAQRFKRTLRWSERFFWAINIILLILFLSHYGKRGQIEALNYLYDRGDAKYVLVDRTDFDTWLPNFYLDVPRENYFWISHDDDWKSFSAFIAAGNPKPKYALIIVPSDIQQHLQFFAAQHINATILEHFGPGPLEWIIWKLNPKYNSTNDVYVVECTYN